MASAAVDAAIIVVVAGIDEIANPALAEGSVIAAIAVNTPVAILANLSIVVVEVLGLRREAHAEHRQGQEGRSNQGAHGCGLGAGVACGHPLLVLGWRG